MANRFLSQMEEATPTPTDVSPADVATPGQPSKNRFLSQIEGVKFKDKESFLKSAGRTALQAPLAWLQKYTWPANLVQLIAQGESIAEFDELEERIPELMKKFPQAPWENFPGLDRDRYMQAVQAASDSFPTQQNIEKLVEDKTGIPLTPQNALQKTVRLGSTAASLRPGGIAPKATAAVVAPLVKKGLQIAGVPEGISEFGGLAVSGAVPSPSAVKQVKPSGLTTRNFEKVTKPTKVSEGRLKAINQAVEEDFKGITHNLTSKNRTAAAIKEDPGFKDKVSELFDDLHEKASKIETRLHTDDVREAFRKRTSKREISGISPDEFEKSFRKESRSINNSIPFERASVADLVDQFRKNNKSLRELYEPGKSAASNRAKKEALLEYNRAIEDVFEKKLPNSEFTKEFQFLNKRWKDIKDVENINDFIDGMFKDKIDYNHARKFFKKNSYEAQSFERVMGPENFDKFKGLMDDLLTTEKAMSLLKKAEGSGFKELAKTAGTFIIHPTLAKAKIAMDLGKEAYQMLLDKPKYIAVWKSGLDAMKKGEFEKADKAFNELKKALLVQSPEKDKTEDKDEK